MGNGFDMVSMLPFVLIFGVFYFLILRPQQQKMKKHQSLLANLKRGDHVVTNGGLIGTISRIVSDSEVQLEIAENTRVRLVRSTITEVLGKSSSLGAGSRAAENPGISSSSFKDAPSSSNSADRHQHEGLADHTSSRAKNKGQSASTLNKDRKIAANSPTGKTKK